uniref:Uncharacterized protein n=1 Tax=Megaselia scalaris TaxID=36166 RepID=T1GZD3_MEGSC
MVDRYIYERGCLRAGEDWLDNNMFSVTFFFLLLTISKVEATDISKIIYEKGCVTAGEEWVERNLIIISTICILILFAQLLAICFAQNLRVDILAQKNKYH